MVQFRRFLETSGKLTQQNHNRHGATVVGDSCGGTYSSKRRNKQEGGIDVFFETTRKNPGDPLVWAWAGVLGWGHRDTPAPERHDPLSKPSPFFFCI